MNLLLVSSWLVISEASWKKPLIFLKFHIFGVKYVLKWTSVRRFQVFLIIFEFFGGQGKFWPKRRRRQFMPRGWIFQKWNHFHDKTTHWDDENIFFKKSWCCYHVAVVQNCRSFGRFDQQLTRHKMEGGMVLHLIFLRSEERRVGKECRL